MAIAAPHVKLLRQLAKAKDDYLSGAFDIEWDGGSATIFMVFGQPSHATYESSGTNLSGEAALDALLHTLPSQFTVGDWRRVMSPQDSLNISVDEITEPIAELVGGNSDVAERDGDATSWMEGFDDSPDLGFDVDSFPLLPSGDVVWPATPAQDAGLRERIGSLDSALVVLSGPRLHGAGVVRDGDLIDAVWVDSADHARGETAAMALLGARDGTIAVYALDGIDVAEAIPMLWRLPRGEPIATAWVDASALVTSLEQDREDHALLIEGPLRAVGLFSAGKPVAVYTSTEPIPVTSTDQLLDAMRRPGTTLRVLQRKGRRPQSSRAGVPGGAAVAPSAPSPPVAPSAPSPPQATDEAEDRYDPFDAFAFQDTPTTAPFERAENESTGWNARDPKTPAPGGSDRETEPATRAGYEPAAEVAGPDDYGARAESAAGTAFEPEAGIAPSSGVDTSSWVDYDEVRGELVAIGVAWLGENDAAAVTECILGTKSAVEAFITTIETIRRMTIPGHDSTAVYTMTREMQVHATDRLCGA
ncbi:MAG: hypothetical protein JOZ75_04830 [Candidatus Dormibacteraeota bacterium]|nr:hypothetical protein [Candidatus Dormibacteraeota bacterium]